MTSTTATTRYENSTRDENRERRDGESSGWRSWFGLGDQKDQDYGRDYKYSKTTTYRNEPGYSTETSPSYGYKNTDRQFPEPSTNYNFGYEKKEYPVNYPTESYRGYSGDSYRSYPSYPSYPSRPSYGQEYPSRPYGPEPRPYGPEPRPFGPEPRPYGPEPQYPTRPYGQEYPSRPYGQEYPSRPYGPEQYPTRPYNPENQYPSRPYGQEEQYPSRPYGQQYSYGSEYPSLSRYNYSGPQQYQSGYNKPYGNQSYSYGRTSYSSNQ